MHADNTSELRTAKGWRKVVEENGDIKQLYIEPGSPWYNASKREIGEIRKEILKATTQTNAPRRRQDFAEEYVAHLISHIQQNNYPML